jgi:hypothetical protein
MILSYAAPAATAVVGWFAGRRKRNNDFLRDMQASIDLLSEKNRELMNEVIVSREKIMMLEKRINRMLDSSCVRLVCNERVLPEVED